MKALMKAVGKRTRRLLMVSCHGVERTRELPFSLQNLMGSLDLQRGAEQERAVGPRGVRCRGAILGRWRGTLRRAAGGGVVMR